MYEMLIAELRSCCCFYGEGCLDCSANGHCRSQMENKAADAIENLCSFVGAEDAERMEAYPPKEE